MKSLKVKELKDILTQNNIEFSSTAKKPELLELIRVNNLGMTQITKESEETKKLKNLLKQNLFDKVTNGKNVGESFENLKPILPMVNCKLILPEKPGSIKIENENGEIFVIGYFIGETKENNLVPTFLNAKNYKYVNNAYEIRLEQKEEIEQFGDIGIDAETLNINKDDVEMTKNNIIVTKKAPANLIYVDVIDNNIIGFYNDSISEQDVIFEKTIQPGILTDLAKHLEIKFDNKFKPKFRDVELLEKTMKNLMINKNILLTGPASSGKNLLAEDIAEKMNLEIFNMSISDDTIREDFAIQPSPGKGGEMEYIISPFLHVMLHGGIIVLDEINMADAEVLAIINSLTDDRGVFSDIWLEKATRDVKGLGDGVTGVKQFKRHPQSFIIATQNAAYEGTKVMNEATASRFSTVFIDRPKSLKTIKDFGKFDLGFGTKKITKEMSHELNRIYSQLVALAESEQVFVPDCLLAIRQYNLFAKESLFNDFITTDKDECNHFIKRKLEELLIAHGNDTSLLDDLK